MLTGRAEPFSVWDDHERRPQTGRVVAAVARVTQEDLRRRRLQTLPRESIHSKPNEQTVSRLNPPAPGDLEDRSVCRDRRWEAGRRPRTSTSQSSASLCCGSASFCSAPPCSPRRCRPPLRSPPPRSTPPRCRRPPPPRSLSFCDVSECWTT